MDRQPICRALVSVFDKTGIEQLATMLDKAGVDVVSTGSTAKALTDAGLKVTEVSTVTGFPECLDGRVKTLHPRIHAGILADRRLHSHRDQLAELGVEPFDLVVCNLYPFSQTVASGAGFDDCIEKIDIGGPSMVRAAAKNHACVAVLTSPAQYEDLQHALDEGGFTAAERRVLAAKAFAHTASYDVAVASWFAHQDGVATDGVPTFVGTTGELKEKLRYGENSHQSAAVYLGDGEPGLAGAKQLHGKAMSYNNSSTPTPPVVPRTTSRSPAWPSSSTPTRAVSPPVSTSPRRIARHMPAIRCRPSAVSSPPTAR